MPEPGPGTDVISRLLAPPRRVRALRSEHEPTLLAAGIDPQWLEDHIRSLAQRFAEPVLARRRASVGVAWPAMRDAYATDALTRDLANAAASVWNETHAAYRALAARWVQDRRSRWSGPRKVRLDADEVRAARRRIVRLGDPLVARIERLSRAAGETEWMHQRARLEALWAECWDAMAVELFDLWADTLADRLMRVARMRVGPPAWLLVLGGIAIALTLALIGMKFR